MQKKNSSNNLKKYATNYSKGRLYKENENLIRSPFQRDRDRIIHSSAFRRLKHKTQVFVNTDLDHYRTRITHSMEVSQISRTLARFLNCDEDLCEAISLAHDLGHTPFGHIGEIALNECMYQYGGFDHNIQTLRIVTIIENKYYKFRGLNLTLETLDGLVKHNGPIYNENKFDSILGKNFFKKKINFINYPSIESQISSISDDIAYNNHDLEDGLRAGLFKLQSLISIKALSSLVKKHIKNIKKYRQEVIVNQIIRDSINYMVKDIIKTTSKNLKRNKPTNINEVYKLNQQTVEFSDKMKDLDEQLKEFLMFNMYKHKKVVKASEKGKKIIIKLFDSLKKNPSKYISRDFLKNRNKERAISDFIAGMTDRYAVNLYNHLK